MYTLIGAVTEMTYYVSSGTLNRTHSHSLTQLLQMNCFRIRFWVCFLYFY